MSPRPRSMLLKRNGITLLEIAIAVALSALLVGATMKYFDPIGQFAKTRNAQRALHLQALLNAVRENMNDNRGTTFTCQNGDLPTSSKKMASLAASGSYNIAPCLVPSFIQTLPFDPNAPATHYTNADDYDTGYYVAKNASGVVTVSAPSAELGQAISVSR